ncbi:MAG: PHP domain-containing protein [Treponema sp.]|jgi:predicted metal-dependent phosphoesterase TrpH|nr:PHP domain-containing protein [Treponema sp.]
MTNHPSLLHPTEGTPLVDLHTHSSASDGSLSPEQLIEEAVRRKLSAIALTDHDTIDGLGPASLAAEERGIRFIPGIELSITWQPGEFHLLGLGLQNIDRGFHQGAENLRRMRERRNHEITERLRGIGVHAEYEEIAALAGGRSVGRPHFAEFLIRRRIVRNAEQAFNRYLGKGRPLYVHKEGLPFQDAVSLIKNAGGLAVIAHPLSLYVAWGKLPSCIASLKEQGLDGIEAWHPSARVGECKRLEKLASSLGLMVTAGSDFHGKARAERKLGRTAGGLPIRMDVESFLMETGPRSEY